MRLLFRFTRCDDRANLVKIFQPTLAARLGALVALVNYLVGKFPWDRDHADTVLLFDLVGHLTQFFAPHMHAAEAKQSFAIVQHRLNHLQAVVRLRFGDPDQTSTTAVHGRHRGFHVGNPLKNRRWFSIRRFFLRRDQTFLG